MKSHSSSLDELNEKIRSLELLEAEQTLTFKKRFQELKHSMAPAALVSTAYNGIKDNKKVQGNILDSSAGMAAGWIIRKIISPKSGGIAKRVTGYFLQYLATKIITKKMPLIREKFHLTGAEK